MAPRPLPTVLAILQHVCNANDYHFECLDPYSKQLVRVSSEEQFFLSGTGRVNAYPLNDASAASVVRDKVFAYQVLARTGIEVPRFEYFFLHDAYRAVRGEGRERRDISAAAVDIGFPLFVKPLDGSRGNLAEVVRSLDELEMHTERIAAVHHGLMLQPVLTGPEYRLFMIDTDALFLYRRSPCFFTGNGERTIVSFLEQENDRRVAQGLSAITLISPFLQHEMQTKGHTQDTVLAPGERFQYLPTANISAGGQIVDFTDTVQAKLARWGARVINALCLRVGAIDFFAPDGLDNESTFNIIEVNSNPSVAGLLNAGHEKTVARIWSEVCERYFNPPFGPNP